MTMVPRAGPFSAISAPATTSWYQRGKSSCRDTIAPLAMGAQATGPVTCRCYVSLRVAVTADDLNLLRRVVGVGPRRLEERPAVGLRLGLRAAVGGCHARLDALAHQSLRFLDQRRHHVGLRDDADDFA